jgi:hypothetical protein
MSNEVQVNLHLPLGARNPQAQYQAATTPSLLQHLQHLRELPLELWAGASLGRMMTRATTTRATMAMGTAMAMVSSVGREGGKQQWQTLLHVL